MKINDKCIYKGSKGNKTCIILDVKIELGPSIQSDNIQTMDLKITTYYMINYEGKDIWVTEGFLEKIQEK